MKRVISTLLGGLLLCGLATCNITTEQPTGTQAITEPGEPVYTVEATIDPDFDAEALFKRLEGVWNTPHPEFGFDGRYIVSFTYQDGKPCLYFGDYDSKGSGFGKLVGGQRTDENKAELSFLFPISSEVGFAPTVTVRIDFTGLDEGKLSMQLACAYEIGDWETYTYNCKTLQEAGINAL